MDETTPDRTPNKGLKLTISWRTMALLLAVVIVVMLALWRPWSDADATGRTFKVTGEATVSAEPDELVFYPSFEVATTEDLATRAGELVAGLKALGVEDKAIKTNANSYQKYQTMIAPDSMPPSGGSSITLQLVITLTNKELSQKVQDYLVAQKASGQITPQGNFSETKRKELQDQATDKATADARERAEKTAGNLGAKIGKVVSITEMGGYGVFPLSAEGRDIAVDNSASSLPINVGENDFTYQLQVEFELK